MRARTTDGGFSLRRSKRAFTLLELVVALVVLGILTALAIPTYSTVVRNTHNTVDVADLHSTLDSAVAAAAERDAHPATLDDIQTSARESQPYEGHTVTATASPHTSTAPGDLSVDTTDSSVTDGIAMLTSTGDCVLATITGSTVTTTLQASGSGTCDGSVALHIDPPLAGGSGAGSGSGGGSGSGSGSGGSSGGAGTGGGGSTSVFDAAFIPTTDTVVPYEYVTTDGSGNRYFVGTHSDGSYSFERITPGGSSYTLDPSSTLGWLNSCQSDGTSGAGNFDPATGDYIVQCGADIKRIAPDGTTTTIYSDASGAYPPKIANGHVFLQYSPGFETPSHPAIVEIGAGGTVSPVFTEASSHHVNSYWTLPNGNLGVLDQTGAGTVSHPMIWTQYSVTPSGTATQVTQFTSNSFRGCYSGDAQGTAYCQDGSSLVTLSQTGTRTQFLADITSIDPSASVQGVESSGVVFIGTSDPDTGALNGFQAVGPGGSVTPVTGNW